MFTIIRNFINKITSQSDDSTKAQQQAKLYDLSKAEKILVIVSLDVGNLPKGRAGQYCEEFKARLSSNSAFSNTELYSIFIIPVRGSIPTTIELYSVPK